jgi:hypothetical protein
MSLAKNGRIRRIRGFSVARRWITCRLKPRRASSLPYSKTKKIASPKKRNAQISARFEYDGAALLIVEIDRAPAEGVILGAYGVKRAIEFVATVRVEIANKLRLFQGLPTTDGSRFELRRRLCGRQILGRREGRDPIDRLLVSLVCHFIASRHNRIAHEISRLSKSTRTYYEPFGVKLA